MAKRWQGPDHNEAVELWNELPDADKQGEKLSVEITIEGTTLPASAEGKVTASSCGEDGERSTVTISKNGEKLTFHTQGAFSAGFSDTLWYGADHFSLCHHLEGLRAIVHFKPSDDKKFAGTITSMELREDLPNPVEKKVPDSFALGN